jgi:anhydro-N-acetylmuramic acid kinase
LAASIEISTVSDFRSLDICLGGQGAPLVPIGDHLLFSDFKACVNLGGFANVSCLQEGKRVAWDVCPVNIISNKLVQANGMAYDDKGDLGRKGELITELLYELNNIEYYKQSHPKSLGQEWLEKHVEPILLSYRENGLSNVLRTYYEHVSIVMANDLKNISGDILFTGGGVYNTFLMELITGKLLAKVTIPNKQLIDYKEALVFALLGVLRLENENNCLATVTGARRDSSSGLIYQV